MSSALIVVGATSGAGKSTLVSALCRAMAGRGTDVAPYKAQNMSNHSAVTGDVPAGEIGRAQAMQARAARVEPEVRMGPVLLKPSGKSSHVVVLGQEVGTDDASSYGLRAKALKPVVLDALSSLRQDHELVVLEGAGGAAEINLLERDLVNLPLAAAAGIPAVLVVDIDRGGAFAAAYGTRALLPGRLRERLVGFIFNGFRGDASLLADGIAALQERTRLPVLGVLPHLGEKVMLGVEDSLDLDAAGRPAATTADPVRVAVLRLPRLANPSDFDPLVTEPAVELRWASRPGDLADADLVVLPGSRATVADLAWLRERGLDRSLAQLAAAPAGPVILGVCAGYQMLGESIADEVESGAGRVPGLGLLPVETTFTEPKLVCRSRGVALASPLLPGSADTAASAVEAAVSGYQIRFGRPVRLGGEPWLKLDSRADADGLDGSGGADGLDGSGGLDGLDGSGGLDGSDGTEGCVADGGRILGTSLHGIFDSDPLRHHLLARVAAARGREFVAAAQPYAIALDAHLDRLADWAEEHLDLDAVLTLASGATPPGQEPGW